MTTLVVHIEHHDAAPAALEPCEGIPIHRQGLTFLPSNVEVRSAEDQGFTAPPPETVGLLGINGYEVNDILDVALGICDQKPRHGGVGRNDKGLLPALVKFKTAFVGGPDIGQPRHTAADPEVTRKIGLKPPDVGRF